MLRSNIRYRPISLKNSTATGRRRGSCDRSQDGARRKTVPSSLKPYFKLPFEPFGVPRELTTSPFAEGSGRCCQEEFVLRSAAPSEPQTIELQNALEVRKQYPKR